MPRINPELSDGEISVIITRLMVQYQANMYRATSGSASDYTKYSFMADKIIDVVNRMENSKAENLNPNAIAVDVVRFIERAKVATDHIKLVRLSGDGRSQRLNEAKKWAMEAYTQIEEIFVKETRIPGAVRWELRRQNRG